MKKLFFVAMLLAFVISAPVPIMAQVSVHIGIPLPPPIVFSVPPVTILLPNTGVYVAPDIPVDLFFFAGWWWRPWEGHWYRSRDYRAGWAYYEGIPPFHGRVPPRWREDYREHHWNGHEWHYQRLSHPELQQIWQRQVRKQSRPPYRGQPQPGRPQGAQAIGLQSHPTYQQPQVSRPQQVRPQPQRPAPQSRPPHGQGHEGRR